MKSLQKLALSYIRIKLNLLFLFSQKKAAEEAFKLFCTPPSKTKRKTEPKNAKRLQFNFNNIVIYGHQWNYPQSKKVLLLHGFSSAAYKFDMYVAPLIKKGYEVLSFDAAAHGKSGGKRTNAVEYSEIIKTIIELYGPIDSFIAHSFGGIALSLALETLPQNKNSKIVFVAPATETTSALEGALTLLKINNYAMHKEIENIIFEISGRKTVWFSIRRAVKNINAQILWVHDEDDEITPYKDVLNVKNDRNSNITFHITKGLGHSKIYKDSKVKETIVSFL